MGIDIKTLVLIIGIAHLMQMLVFYHQYIVNKKNIKGSGWWFMWSAAESLAFVLILLRGIPSILPIVIIFQDIIILSGTLFIYIGLVRFFEKKVNWKFCVIFLGSFITLHLFFILVKDEIYFRSLILSVFLSFISFRTALSIYKNKNKSVASTANFIIIIFIVHGAVFTYRAVMIVLGADVTDSFSPVFFNFLPYFDALVVGLLWTFSFIILVNQRLISDISEAKKHFELIFETSPDASVISRLSDGLLVNCNESYSRISGFSKEEIIGKSSLDIHLWKNPEDRHRVTTMIKEKGFCENVEILFRHKDGGVIIGLMSAKAIIIKGDLHIISVTHDISDIKRAEEVLKLKNEQLLELNTEKDKFFSIIAHDLRGPINSFLGLTQIMADEFAGLTMGEINTIALSLKKSATNIYSLLENLLLWARIQQGLISFNPQKLSLTSIINVSKALSAEPAKRKDIEIIFDDSNDIEIFADSNILQIVIRNLVSNAVKFTPKGGKIEISAKNNTDDFVEIAIKDNGIGMSKEMIDYLFSLDKHTCRTGTEGEPSTGLGLILCRDFIEMHKGRLWAESEEEKGSAFYFTIPSKEENISQTT